MSHDRPLSAAVNRAVLIYRVDAAIAFLAAAAVIIYAVSTGNIGAIIFLTLVAVIPGLVGLAALMVAIGLRPAARNRVLRGANVVQTVYGLASAGLGIVAVRFVFSLFDDDVDSNKLLVGIIILGFLAVVAFLAWFSFAALRHPEVHDHLGLDRRTGQPLPEGAGWPQLPQPPTGRGPGSPRLQTSVQYRMADLEVSRNRPNTSPAAPGSPGPSSILYKPRPCWPVISSPSTWCSSNGSMLCSLSRSPAAESTSQASPPIR